MAQKNWQNPYIELVANKPDLILPGPKHGCPISQVDREYLENKLNDFQEIICEPCCGSGAHLVAVAQENPKALCIGFEQRYKRAYSVAIKAERLGLKNVLVIQNDAALIAEILESRKVKALYLNFPDPWQKRRLQKHRLLTAGFIGTVAQLLDNKGFFSYKTDHREYFDETVAIIRGQADLSISDITYDLYSSKYLTGNISTEFESLFKTKGFPIHMLIAKRS